MLEGIYSWRIVCWKGYRFWDEMNPFDNDDKGSERSVSISSSTSSSGDSDEVNRLMQALIPKDEIKKESEPLAEKESGIEKSMARIETIRKSIRLMEDSNCALEKLIHQYEIESQQEERVRLQHVIAERPQRSNRVAASSRVQ